MQWKLWGFITFWTSCAFFLIAPELAAQTRLPPVEDEIPAATAWPVPPSWEQQAITQPPPPPIESPFLDLRPTPRRPELAPDSNDSDGSMLGGPPGGSRSPFSAYAFFQPASDLQNPTESLQVRGEGFSLGLPVSIQPQGIWILNTKLEHQAFATTATLPGGVQAFPDELWNINVSLMHIHTFDNGWKAGGMVGFGSASDRPFASLDEMNFNLLAFLNIPSGERDAWNLSLFYTPLGQLAFPVPGIAYAWRPSEQFRMNIGLPFSLHYRPTETWSFDLNYLPLTNAQATVRWTPSDFWTLYAGYQTESQGYQLADRVDTEERLFHFDQRLKLGVRRKLLAGFELDASAAYLFDRSYFLNDSFFGDDIERLRIQPGMQFLLKLEWKR